MSEKDEALALAKDALALVSVALPHLSGLAHRVELSAHQRVRTACVFASGRVTINPLWFARLDRDARTFVLAHELLHLALGTHARGEGADAAKVNIAHDYIINDMLAEELKMNVPAGGLEYPGARRLSLEDLVLRLGGAKPSPAWSSPSSGVLAGALAKAGLVPPDLEIVDGGGDVLSAEDERSLFPHLDAKAQAKAIEQTRGVARRALGLHALKNALASAKGHGAQESEGEVQGALTEALASTYRAPWELAVQRWIEALAPGPRTYARPSRRDGGRSDVVLPGRARQGWTLHIILDTSGSMTSELPELLDIIGRFAEAAGVEHIHLIQCDTAVARDEWVSPAALSRFELAGFGGSDLSPAILALDRDEEVEAAVIITDGGISFPPEAPHFEVLWAVTESSFRPPYGKVLRVHVANKGQSH